MPSGIQTILSGHSIGGTWKGTNMWIRNGIGKGTIEAMARILSELERCMTVDMTTLGASIVLDQRKTSLDV